MNSSVKIILLLGILFISGLSAAPKEISDLKQKLNIASFKVRQNLKQDAIYNFRSYLERDMSDPMDWKSRKHWIGLGKHHIFPLKEYRVLPEAFLKEIMLLRKSGLPT